MDDQTPKKPTLIKKVLKYTLIVFLTLITMIH